ncbi:FG-GAP repeat domain-containing protein, partial [Streptomyces diastatochromogenes]|uniref:FG-GAP repeat domain-containing protein n=1 Tax=Streptomyces diastatochromogenes TaxID=42236 RepID=UPI0036930701
MTGVVLSAAMVMAPSAHAQSLFDPAVNYAVGDVPASVAVGDFNGDGKLDLVTANANSDNVSVLPGIGDGTFAGPG